MQMVDFLDAHPLVPGIKLFDSYEFMGQLIHDCDCEKTDSVPFLFTLVMFWRLSMVLRQNYFHVCIID